MKFKITLLLLFLLSGCSTQNLNTGRINHYSSVAFLIEKYGQVIDPLIEQRLNNIQQKLLNDRSISIVVINHDSANAYTAGGNIIILSLALINKIQSDDQLSFIIAHEYAHLFLNHNHTVKTNPKYQYQSELDADIFAKKLVEKSGYNYRAALEVFLNPSLTNWFNADNNRYPSANKRYLNAKFN